MRGIHIAAPKADEMPACLRFIREGMPKEGANLLVLEFNYRYQYTKRPEVVDSDALTREQVKEIVAYWPALIPRPEIEMRVEVVE